MMCGPPVSYSFPSHLFLFDTILPPLHTEKGLTALKYTEWLFLLPVSWVSHLCIKITGAVAETKPQPQLEPDAGWDH